MKFFAIHLEDLESEAFTMASDEQVVIWLYLHAYCCKQCNGGEIEDADKIPAKLWRRHGIDEPEILKEESTLWEWEEGTLRLLSYDIDGQIQYEKKAAGGLKGSKRRWAKHRSREAVDRTPNGSPNGTDHAPNTTLPHPTQDNPTREENTPPNPTEDNTTQPESTGTTTEDIEDWAKSLGDLGKLIGGGGFGSGGGGGGKYDLIREGMEAGLSEADAESAWQLYDQNGGRDQNRKQIGDFGMWARKLIDGRKRSRRQNEG